MHDDRPKRDGVSLPVPDEVRAHESPTEIARIWKANNVVVSLRPETYQPFEWGMVLVDLAHHLANGYEQMGGYDREEILGQILQGFEAEWNNRTDDATGGYRP